jgi:hypothetical protein
MIVNKDKKNTFSKNDLNIELTRTKVMLVIKNLSVQKMALKNSWLSI